MVKTGILGGTFNPIHIGHLSIAEQVYEKLKLDKVIFIPTGISYKKLELKVLPRDLRQKLTELAISDNPNFECSDIELTKDGYSYTCDTLVELKKLYPDNEFYYIIGADNLFGIEKWNEPELIFKNCILTVASRGDYDISLVNNQKRFLEDRYSAKIIILKTGKIDISSTDIRNSMLNSDFETAREMLDKKSYDFIIENKLYEYWRD